MSQLKRICYIFVAVLGVACAVVTKSVIKDPQAVSTDELNSAPPILPSPSPLKEFSSRLGVRGDTKYSQDNFKPSVTVNVDAKLRNSSVSASSKSPQISYPDQRDEKSVENEHGPHSLVLKLLDDKESSDSPSSKEENKEIYGRARYPKIYYGEVSPPYPAHEEGPPGDNHSGPRHHSEQVQQEEPKHYYPKHYMKRQTGNKKKRFEYKHEEQRQSSEHHQGTRHHASQEISQIPEKLDNPDHEGYGDEGSQDPQDHQRGKEYDHRHQIHEQGYGYPEHGQHHGNKYRHGHGVDVIGKALKVLIPSALFLTGVSALFPNRLHVPTNDYSTVSYDNRRHRRSIEYNDGLAHNYNGPISPNPQMLEREHRSLNMGNNPRPSYEYNNFENIGPYGDYNPSMFDRSGSNEFDILPASQEQGYPTAKGPSYGQKVRVSNNGEFPFIRRPSTPQEYDQFNYGPQVSPNEFTSEPDSLYEPVGLALKPTIPTPEITPELNLKSEYLPTPPTESPKQRHRRVRVRTGIRKKIRSRPLPASSESSAAVPTLHRIQKSVESKIDPLRRANHNRPDEMTARESKKLEDLVSSFHSIKQPADAYLKSIDGDAGNKEVDLSPNSPVMGLITSYAQHDSDSPTCQKRALCELALKGGRPTASKFESFLWSLATLVPDQFSKMYELEDIFKAIRTGECLVFQCRSPNLDIQA